MPSRSARLANSSPRSTRAIFSNIEWWLTHMMPITTNEITNATYDGHWWSSASSRLPFFTCGTRICSTRSVIAIAITPSLNASSRWVVALGVWVVAMASLSGSRQEVWSVEGDDTVADGLVEAGTRKTVRHHA